MPPGVLPDSYLNADADTAMQVGDGAAEDMVDVVFKDWPYEQGVEATRVLDLFLVHGMDPGIARLKVSELFSPPRVTEQLRILPDFAFFEPGSTYDLRADKDGRCWDFLRADHRKEVRRQIAEQRPYLVVGLTTVHRFLSALSWSLRPAHVPRRSQEEESQSRDPPEILCGNLSSAARSWGPLSA